MYIAEGRTAASLTHYIPTPLGWFIKTSNKFYARYAGSVSEKYVTYRFGLLSMEWALLRVLLGGSIFPGMAWGL